MTIVNEMEFIIACAGYGTRNYPQAKGLPHKCLMPFGSYRLIDHILKDVIAVGGKHITIIISNEEVKHAFTKALANDVDVQEKLIKKGMDKMAEVLKSVSIPEDIDIKYVMQEEALGTAQCLCLAYNRETDRDACLIFPDDMYFAADDNNTHLHKILDNFSNNNKQILVQGITREDVSNNAILQNGRLVEKPTNPDTNVGGFPPYIFPKEMMRYTYNHMDDNIETIRHLYRTEGKEWVYTDAINSFLDSEEGSAFELKMPVKDDEDFYMDTGNSILYEKALLYSLLNISKYKEEHKADVKKLLD